MHIAMIGSRGMPARHGGVETAVEELSVRLAARGHEVTVYCRQSDYPTPERCGRYRGVRTVYLPSREGKHTAALVHAGLATAHALRDRAEVLHFHAMGPTLFSPLARARRSARVVATVQGRDDQRAKWSPAAQRLLRTAAWTSTHVPDTTITVSRDLQRDVRRTFGCDSVYVPNGISPVGAPKLAEAAGRAALARRGLEPGHYVLNVGRLVPEKALDGLLRAYRNVPRDIPLAIAGTGDESSEFVQRLRALAALDPRVLMLGAVHGAELDTLFRGALAFAQVSRLEGLPLALLEAAAYARPLIVSDIAPHLEVIGQGGPGSRSFPVGDETALAETLRVVLTNADSEGVAARGVSTDVLRRYDWEAITEATLRVYRGLAVATDVIDLRDPARDIAAAQV